MIVMPWGFFSIKSAFPNIIVNKMSCFYVMPLQWTGYFEMVFFLQSWLQWFKDTHMLIDTMSIKAITFKPNFPSCKTKFLLTWKTVFFFCFFLLFFFLHFCFNMTTFWVYQNILVHCKHSRWEVFSLKVICRQSFHASYTVFGLLGERGTYGLCPSFSGWNQNWSIQ